MEYFDVEDPSIKERTILSNSQAFAFLSQMPIVPGHSLICPLRVVETSDELTFSEWQAILDIQQELCSVLKDVFKAEGFNFAWNVGDVAGQTVPHFHMHVVPRKEGDAGILQYEPRVFLYRPGSRAVSPEEELKQTAELIRNHL